MQVCTFSYHLQNPAIADVYTEHSTRVRVAKYSPSGFYIASAGNKRFLNYVSSVKESYTLRNCVKSQPVSGQEICAQR